MRTLGIIGLTISLIFLYMEAEARYIDIRPQFLEMFQETKKETHFQEMENHQEAMFIAYEKSQKFEKSEEPEEELEYLGEWVVTAYYSPIVSDGLNCSGDCRVTASGHRLKDEEAEYVVACPREYTFGTQFRIEGIDHNVWCRDRGGAIKGGRLDLWMGGHKKKQEALNFGKQTLKIYLVK